MTRGATPQFASTPYAQWLRVRLEELHWKKQDLAAELVKAAPERLGEAGAAQLVYRASSGKNIIEENRELLDRVLGSPEAEAVEEAQKVSDRLAALEGAVEAAADEMADSLERLEAAIVKLSRQLQRGGAQGRNTGP